MTRFLIRLRSFPICLFMALTCMLAAGASAHAAAFTPKLGQSGKDVMWLPTPDALVTRLLKMARLSETDTLVDLGSGDGKIVIAAARDFGAQARGVEYDPRLVEVAQAAALQAGVDSKTRFTQGDIFETDFSGVDVVAMYLLPQLNLRLRPALLAMKPGTRVVTHWFDMGEWQADETTEVENRPGYLWIVPANVHGTWNVQATPPAATPPAATPPTATAPATTQPTATARAGTGSSDLLPIDEMTFNQRYQKVEGVLALKDVKASLLQPVLVGSDLSFEFTDREGVRQQARARIEGDVMHLRIWPASDLEAGQTRPSARAARSYIAHRVGEAQPLPGSEPASEAEMGAAIASLGNE